MSADEDLPQNPAPRNPTTLEQEMLDEEEQRRLDQQRADRSNPAARSSSDPSSFTGRTFAEAAPERGDTRGAGRNYAPKLVIAAVVVMLGLVGVVGYNTLKSKAPTGLPPIMEPSKPLARTGPAPRSAPTAAPISAPSPDLLVAGPADASVPADASASQTAADPARPVVVQTSAAAASAPTASAGQSGVAQDMVRSLFEAVANVANQVADLKSHLIAIEGRCASPAPTAATPKLVVRTAGRPAKPRAKREEILPPEPPVAGLRRPRTALLAVDTWNSKPSVVVMDTPANGNTSVQFLAEGDQQNGAIVKRADPRRQAVTVQLGDAELELTRAPE